MFWQIFLELCNKNDTTPTAVVSNLHIAGGSVTKWKDGSVPRGTTLQKIANYFGVTVDYLLGKEEKKPSPVMGKDSLEFLNSQNLYFIPVFESVSAGFGAYPDDRIEDYMPCYITSKAEAEQSICIKVSGDSMYPKIEDGDTILVLKQTTVDNGTIAVLLIDGEEAVVKRVELGPDWIKLVSINPLYPPMTFKGADVQRVQVLGIVKKIIKVV